MSLQFLPLSDIQNVDKIADLIKKYATANKQELLVEYKEKCKKLIENKDYYELVSQTLQLIEQTTTEQKMIQQIYSAITYYITLLNEDQQKKGIELYYNHLVKLGQENNGFKVRMQEEFALLFNSFPTKSKFSFPILKKLIDLGFQVNQQSLLMHSVICNLRDLFKQWELNEEQMIDFVLYILDKLDLNNNLFSNQDNTELIQVLMDIQDKNQILKYEKNLQQCLIYYINSNPNITNLDDLKNKSIYQVLQQNKNSIVQLIEQILDGNITQCKQLIEKEKYNKLNEQLALNLARIQHLGLMAEQQFEFTYAEIATNLQLSQDDVEIWIISGIQSQNLQAQIDQDKNTVYIKNNSTKAVTKRDWQLIYDKLQKLQEQIQVQ